jgi:hypothetical protein
MAGDNMVKPETNSQEWIDKIEQLVHRAESLPDANARNTAVELVQAVLDFHSAGLERMIAIASDYGPDGEALIERIAMDDLTSSMLLLHDLHPHDLETRLNRAIRELQKMFASLGASLSLISIEPEMIRLQFESRGAWAGTAVRASIENAIFQAAPEIENVIVEGLKETPLVDFVPISDLLTGSRV